MKETLIEYETVLRGRDGARYRARSCGREREDGSWEGWLEFVPPDGADVLVSGRETTQPSRETLRYWASGLTDPYLDGALLRAQTEFARPSAGTAAPPVAAGPAVSHGQPATAARAVLDPFQVHAEGADILRSQLAALSADQLRNIVWQYGLSAAEPAVLDVMTQKELIALIVAEVERAKG